MGNFWDNIKFLSIAGVGLFGDGYMNITIGLVVPMIGYLYYADEDGEVPTVPSDVIKGALAVSGHHDSRRSQPLLMTFHRLA
jgi:PHS family inorganic phosphate transporter-like MFS transporter